MSRRPNPSRAHALLAILLATGLGACSAPSAPGANTSADTADARSAAAELDPLLADPRPDDLWAAELSYFSGAVFSDDEDKAAYGLMKVIEVSADKIVLITETGAWPRSRGAVNELRGDLGGIVWDREEEIPLYREELPALAADGKIFETRRLQTP